jgi:hypothetical protein
MAVYQQGVGCRQIGLIYLSVHPSIHPKAVTTSINIKVFEEWRLLGCYAVWFLQEPHGVTSQKMPLFIVTTVKTSNLT